MGTVYFNSDI